MVLFDLASDPMELRGVPVDPADPGPATSLLQRIEREKATWSRPAVGTEASGDLDPEQEARLREMGYGGGDDD